MINTIEASFVVTEPERTIGDKDKLYVRLKSDILVDLLTAVQYYCEQYNLWDHDPDIHVYENVDGYFYAYMSWRGQRGPFSGELFVSRKAPKDEENE